MINRNIFLLLQYFILIAFSIYISLLSGIFVMDFVLLVDNVGNHQIEVYKQGIKSGYVKLERDNDAFQKRDSLVRSFIVRSNDELPEIKLKVGNKSIPIKEENTIKRDGYFHISVDHGYSVFYNDGFLFFSIINFNYSVFLFCLLLVSVIYWGIILLIHRSFNSNRNLFYLILPILFLFASLLFMFFDSSVKEIMLIFQIIVISALAVDGILKNE